MRTSAIEISHQCRSTVYISRVGQNRIYTPYMTEYLVISLPKIPYIDRIYMVLANPVYKRMARVFKSHVRVWLDLVHNARAHIHPLFRWSCSAFAPTARARCSLTGLQLEYAPHPVHNCACTHTPTFLLKLVSLCTNSLSTLFSNRAATRVRASSGPQLCVHTYTHLFVEAGQPLHQQLKYVVL